MGKFESNKTSDEMNAITFDDKHQSIFGKNIVGRGFGLVNPRFHVLYATD